MIVKLGEIAEIFSGVHISRVTDSSSDEIPVIKNKFEENFILQYSMMHISDDINKRFISKKGDIIISLSQPNSVSILHKEGFIIPMYFAVVRLKKGYDSSFIYHLMNSDYFHNKLHALLEGGSLKVIKVADLKKIKINIPDIEKQKEYAELLNLIDKKNILLDNKKNCNKKIKEYMIQTQVKGE